MDMIAPFCVYALINVVDGDRCYIGATNDFARRWRCHKSDARHGKKHLIARALREFGSGSFEREVLEWCETEEEALKAEVFWIEWYRSFGPDGYNMAIGGKGNVGWEAPEEWREKASKRASLARHTDATRRKMSETARFRPPATVETKAKISASAKSRSDQTATMNRNRVWSEDARRKIAESNRSRDPISQETRTKMSMAQKGRVVSDETKRRTSVSLRKSTRAKILTFRGESLCLTEWAERVGVKRLVLTKRLIRGWSIKKTLTTPVVDRG